MPADKRNTERENVAAAGSTADPDSLGSAATAEPLAMGTQGATGLDETIERAASSAGDLNGLVTATHDHYELGAEIARGGMGRIVHARDRRLGRDIAIKELLSPSPALERRFEREMKITARLQHPAIISVLDAGRWPSGEQFYTMKYVKGRPLDAVIKDTSTIAERLALVPNVIAVADALAYAHDQHVIHRDLKPANVLVGDYGETVVIDWGLAKDLRDGEAQEDLVATDEDASDDALTVVGEAMGTPAYMSPRQARGETVDRQADVYALGAMLYHLLAGQMPYTDKKVQSVHELLALVKSEAPTELSEVAPDVPSDLLAVVDKAMARATADRYTSAKELAADLRRFQNGQRVGVHQYTPRQLVGRWLRRHLAAVSVASAAIVLLVAGGVVSVTRIVREQRQAEVERKLAEESRADAETFMDFMLIDLFSKLEPVGRLPLLGAVAKEASDYYKQRPEARTSGDQERRARALRNLGDVLLAQGDAAMAMGEYRAALAIAGKLVAQDPTNAGWLRDLSVSHIKVGDVLVKQGDVAMAMSEYRAALAIGEKLVAQDPTNAGWQRGLSVSHDRVGTVLVKQGDTFLALGAYRSSVAIREKLVTQDPTNAGWLRDLSVSHIKVGDVLVTQGDAAIAMGEYRAALAIGEKLAVQDPTHTGWQRDLAVSHIKVGDVLLAQGELALAMRAYRASLAIRGKLAAQDPTATSWLRDISVCHNKVGDVFLAQGDVAMAMGEYRSSLTIREKLVTQDPTNASWQRDLTVSHDRVGNVLLKQGDVAKALSEYRSSLAIREKLAAQDPANASWQRDLSASHDMVGDVLVALGDPAKALGAYRSSLAIHEKLAAQAPANASWQRDVLVGHNKVGDVLLAQGDAAKALGAYRSSIAIVEKLAAQDPTNTRWQHDLVVSHDRVGTVLVKQGERSMALTEYKSALAIMEKLVAQNPTNAQWKADLSEVRGMFADCCKAGQP